MLRFQFTQPKIKENGHYMKVRVTKEDGFIQEIDVVVNSKGNLEAFDFTPFMDEGLDQETQHNIFEKQMNEAWNFRQKLRASKKEARDDFKIKTHWYYSLDNDEKTALCSKLSASLISIVDSLIASNPTYIKNDHYNRLIERSQRSEITFPSITASKLSRLPKLEIVKGERKLVGSRYAFISLAECIYPSLVRARDTSVVL